MLGERCQTTRVLARIGNVLPAMDVSQGKGRLHRSSCRQQRLYPPQPAPAGGEELLQYFNNSVDGETSGLWLQGPAVMGDIGMDKIIEHVQLGIDGEPMLASSGVMVTVSLSNMLVEDCHMFAPPLLDSRASLAGTGLGGGQPVVAMIPIAYSALSVSA